MPVSHFLSWSREKSSRLLKNWSRKNWNSPSGRHRKAEMSGTSHCGFKWQPEENVPVPDQPSENRREDDRIALLNKVNMGLIERINFGQIRDGRDKEKIQSFKDVIDRLCATEKTSEFVLQVALYARRGLNIRTAANFMVACAACHAESKGPGSGIEIGQLP